MNKQLFYEIFVKKYNEHSPNTDEVLKYKFGFKSEDLDLFNNTIFEILRGKDFDELDNVGLREKFNYTNLSSFNVKNNIYYYNSHVYNKEVELLSLQLELNNTYNNLDISKNDFAEGFIFSEVESSLSIEDIHTTKKRINEISKKQKKSLDDNELIIYNMIEGYNFILNSNITEDNLYKLYKILSFDCLGDDLKLVGDNYYRTNNDVYIQHYNTCPSDKLPILMKQLIDYINENKDEMLTQHVAHFYLLYLHPYNDYNGRTARALAFWINLKSEKNYAFNYISEAIKFNKVDYYKCINLTRNNNNDLTYFINGILDLAIKYVKINYNISLILDTLEGNGLEVKNSYKEFLYVIFNCNLKGEGYFGYKKIQPYFIEKKQKTYLLRVLNELVMHNVLILKKSKTNLYKLNYKDFDILKV